MANDTYPPDYNPPPPYGKCEKCGCQTKGYGTKWLALCPKHWQEIARLPRA